MTMVSLCGVSVGNAAAQDVVRVVHYCNNDGCKDAPMDQYAYGFTGSWGIPDPPISSQVPPGGLDLITYHNYACSSTIPITISVTLPGTISAAHPYGDPTIAATVPVLGAQTSGTLTFAMPNIGQKLTDGIYVPGVTFLESWGAWPISDCTLNGRRWGAGPGLETLSIKSLPPGSCQAAGQQQVPRSPALSLFGSSSSCPLVVEVAPLEGGSPHSVPVGLHYDSVSGKPSFFVPNQEDPILPYVAIRPFSGEPFSQKCGTGCSNVVVHVTEPAVAGEEGKVVRGATVKLTASQVAPSGAAYPYPSFLSLGLRPFTGQVCAVKGVGEGGCGASAEATTDERGNAYFRYWAPGVVSSGTVLLTGTARDKSSACACGSRSGTNTADLDLSPDVVFVRDAPLSQQVVDYFTAWYGHKLIFDDVSWATGVITTVFPELKVADQIGKIASSSQGPDIVAALVLFALFHLSPDGLVITDLRDSSALHGFFGNGFLTGFVSMMKDFAGYMHPACSTRAISTR
jgi:hypothetical protein